MDKEIICSICGEVIDGYGHCAQPVKNGRCCDKCNNEIVIPRRVAFFKALENFEPHNEM